MSPAMWKYGDRTQSAPLLSAVYESGLCPCCAHGQRLNVPDRRDESDGRRYSIYERVMWCDVCGWWFFSSETFDSSCGARPDHAIRTVNATGAALREFGCGPDDEDLAALTSEIQAHMNGLGTSFEWAILEDVTKGVFREFGYEALVTARSKDGGIDVIVEHTEAGDVYAQVKHSKNKVGVRVLRELVGTMAINGATNALLVTSSRFTRGVTREQALAAQRGFFVELVDGDRLLSALNLTFRVSPPTLPEVRSLAAPNVQLRLEEISL